MPVEVTRSARALEATGAAEVTFDFRGTAVTIPRPLEAWPLGDIRAGRSGRALKALLRGQRPPMRTQSDALELSIRMADACGVTPLPESTDNVRVMFGAVPTLLRLLDNHGDDLEADLRRFYGVDMRGLFTGDLTLRQLWMFVRRIPGDSALLTARNGGRPPWTRAEIIAARQWEAWVRKPYDGRPASPEEIEAWRKKQAAVAATNDRLAEREAYYASGQNMRDAGIDTAGQQFDTPGHERPPQEHQPSENDPVARAVAVAKRNATRSRTNRNTNGRTADGQPQPGFRNGRWDNAGRTW
ncbi:hypothetical protein SEA_GRAVAILLIA_17 [Mycobacterium phage Gravaillia]|nr:hypothetical protein SEA_GRAVAILLIA_17 [Mycobacterium phage Gravaillia]